MIERNYITPEIREDLAKTDADCIRLHVPPPPVIFLRTEVADIESGEIEFVQTEKANSFNRNYYNAMVGHSIWGMVTNDTTFGAGHLNRKRPNATVTSFGVGMNSLWNRLKPPGAINDATYGVLIGTGTGAESFEGYAIGTLIAHGTGAGQMSYAAGSFADATYAAETKKWTSVLTRVMSNTSGGSISVSEVCIYAGMQCADTWEVTMIERSVLASPVAVANNKKITVTYTFEMTFPA